MTTSTTPDLSLNLRGDLTDPLFDVRGRKMSNLFEQYPKIQRIYPAPLQANAGPLTQWELIFYGTETPAQESDVSTESNVIREEGQAVEGGFKAGAEAGTVSSGCATLTHQPPHRCLGLFLLLILFCAADAFTDIYLSRRPRRELTLTTSNKLPVRCDRPPRAPCLNNSDLILAQ
ncbi:unnamed protein product [Danaus chrysippus]|uniref:(African queen) hypothetical protein n=1 Tax=Danaus chrysippus TaxID=151541 RepID=A0A8J2VUF3_9NEOP|nr:unnamed protein product [Danaus chrysippus]